MTSVIKMMILKLAILRNYCNNGETIIPADNYKNALFAFFFKDITDLIGIHSSIEDGALL